MSTRAQIKITDKYNRSVLFYRHSDGYPEGALPSLTEFMRMVVAGKIRDTVEQASGWLVEIGRREYADMPIKWKIGAYEPSCDLHRDTEFFYILDLAKRTITVQSCDGEEESSFTTIETIHKFT